jgi:hypothetical protein
MFECFLLLRNTAGAKWMPFFAVPMVIAGCICSFSIFLSGLKGLLAARLQQEKPKTKPARLGLRENGGRIPPLIAGLFTRNRLRVNPLDLSDRRRVDTNRLSTSG